MVDGHDEGAFPRHILQPHHLIIEKDGQKASQYRLGKAMKEHNLLAPYGFTPLPGAATSPPEPSPDPIPPRWTDDRYL